MKILWKILIKINDNFVKLNWNCFVKTYRKIKEIFEKFFVGILVFNEKLVKQLFEI